MSALVVCLICDRQRHVFDQYGIGFCSNCGVMSPYIIRDPYEWEEKDGINKFEARRRTYAGLKWLRDTKNYKPKWADARYRAIFGDWPPREIQDVPPDPPTANLVRRVHIDNQHWKKEKRKEEITNKPMIAIIPRNPVQASFMTEDDWAVKL